MPIQVAVGVLRAASGAILVARRPPGAHLGGLWEFPGGKRHRGESRPAALARELSEEIGITVRVAEPLIRIRHAYSDRSVELDVWEVQDWTGEVRGREGQEVRWVLPEELRGLDFPVADRGILGAIALPDVYLVTPEPPADASGHERFLAGVARCLDAGVRLIQLRAKTTGADPAALDTLVDRARDLCAVAGARLLLNLPADPGTGERRADGVHLTSARLERLSVRPPGVELLGASCHSPDELRRAERLGADFAVLGPVRPTASHPDAIPIGWQTFERWVAEVNLPVYALGGMGPRDVAEARTRGGRGIAAIRSLWDRPEALRGGRG